MPVPTVGRPGRRPAALGRRHLAGVEVGPHRPSAKAGDEPLGRRRWARRPTPSPSSNTAFAPEPVLVRVAPGTVVDQPIVVHVHAASTGAAVVRPAWWSSRRRRPGHGRRGADVGPDVGLVSRRHRDRRGRRRPRPPRDRAGPRTPRPGRSPPRSAGSARRRRLPGRRRPPSAATTPACAPTAAWRAGAPPARCWPPTWAMATRCSTSAPSRTTPPPTPPASSCSRGRWPDRPAPSTPGLIRVRPERPGHRGLPDQPEPQALRARLGRVGAQPRDREQRRALLATPPPSAPSTRTSASTSRAGACRPPEAERLIVAGFFDDVLDPVPRPGRRRPRPGARSPARWSRT